MLARMLSRDAARGPARHHGMLIVGLIFIAVIALGETLALARATAGTSAQPAPHAT